MKRYFRFIFGLILSLLLMLVGALPSIAAPTAPDDFSQISFSQLPPITGNGSLQEGGISRTWQAGQTPDQFLTLGDIQEMQPQEMSIDSISQATGLQLSTSGISDFQPLAQQSVGSLMEAAPNLGNLPIQDMPALQSLFGEKSDSVVDAETLQSGTLSQVVQQFPQLSNLNLNAIDLKQFAISSLPGMSSLPISQLQGWQNAPISGVPGMNQVPMGSFPNPMDVAGGVVMRIDFIHAMEEADRQNTISGSDVEGFRVPCTIGRKDCAYIELDDLENSGDSQQSRLEGVQWISGKYQEVNGGHGALKTVNRGKEPTGRLPFGNVFKVVVWEPDETKDSVTTALYTRFCHDPENCTPYFIGPIPFMTYKRDSPIFVGLVELGQSSSKSSTPTHASKGGAMPAMVTFDAGSFGMGGGGNGQTCTVDPSKLDGATKAAIAAVDPASQAGAGNMVPYIMQACAKAGITDSDQLAYILATAEHETDHFRTMKEYGNPSYDACGGGEGMIQVTWCDSKAKVFQRLGLPAYGGRSDTRLQTPTVAADALCRGMKEGWFGQRRPIGECIGGGKVNYQCARQQVNGNDRWQEIGARADRIKAGLAKGGGAGGSTPGMSGAVTCTTSGGMGGSGGSIPAGVANSKIIQAVGQMGNFSSASGPDGGNEACAWAVNKVMAQSGIRPIGENPNYVPSVEAALQGGRGQQVSAGQAQAGDIVIAPGQAHIGICMNAGCSTVRSNSSSRASFAWNSNLNFDGYYGSGTSRIYRVTQP